MAKHRMKDKADSPTDMFSVTGDITEEDFGPSPYVKHVGEITKDSKDKGDRQ
jgi:hypothetical protein